MSWSLAVHGGAGTPPHGTLDPGVEAARRRGLRRALAAGGAVLAAGGEALEAVCSAVQVLEEDPLFNAGRGSVYASDATQRLDASVMTGDRRAGAVCDLRRVRSPIRAARAVLAHSPHVFLCGAGAESFARAQGLEMVEPAWFADDVRRAQLDRALIDGVVVLDHAGRTSNDGEAGGTVGAVARDLSGRLAAATSTGGMTAKAPGRVGDSAVVGAGTWADDATCAVSATGHGERFIESAVAARISALIELAGLDVVAAAQRVVLQELVARGAEGGVIAVGADGRLSLPFNSGGMARAARYPDGRIEVVSFLAEGAER